MLILSAERSRIRMLGFGTIELLILLVLVMVFFGAGKMTSLGKVLGRSVGSFRQGTHDAEVIDITPSGNKRSR